MDAMRALAVLAVVAVHAAVFGRALSGTLTGHLLAHLNIGVTIFFLISGFLLYRPFIAHRGGGAPAPAGTQYLKRRFLRIYPGYWAVLSFLVLAPGFIGVVDGNGLAMYSLTQTLPVNPGPACSQLVTRCSLAQTWSLGAELTFYLALPAYAWIVTRLTRRLALRSWLFAELAVLAALSTLSVLIAFVILSHPPSWVGWTVLGNTFWFSLGMGMAVVSVAAEGGIRAPWLLRGAARHPALMWTLALSGYVALASWLPTSPFFLARMQALVAHLGFGVIAALALIPAFYGDAGSGLPRRLLAHPVMTWLGLVSYGIFLWHYAVVLELGSPGAHASFLLVLVGTLAISIPCAAASYYLIERPCLRLKYLSLRAVLHARASAASRA